VIPHADTRKASGHAKIMPPSIIVIHRATG